MFKTPDLELKLLKTNYMVCCWSGDRRIKDARQQANYTFYIKNHIDSLMRLKHNLTQITITIPDNHYESRLFRSYIDSLPSFIQKSKVVIYRRPNVGMTYGCLSEVYNMYKDEFDYYFVVEDDYKFCQNEFDSIFVKEMLKRPQCGFLAGLTGGVYADMHIGCIRQECLEKASIHNNGVLYPVPWYHQTNGDQYIIAYNNGQINFGKLVREVGYTIEDIGNRHSVCFRDSYPNGVRWFNKNKSKPPIIVPI